MVGMTAGSRVAGRHRVALAVLVVATLLALAAIVPLVIVARGGLLSNAATSLALLGPFAVLGVLVARRQPHNPIGWLALAFGLGFLVSGDASSYLEAT
jgi:hypothetical protein